LNLERAGGWGLEAGGYKLEAEKLELTTERERERDRDRAGLWRAATVCNMVAWWH